MKTTVYIGVISLFISFLGGCVQPEEIKDPVACFNTSKNTFKVNETVTFTNCSSNANSYGWNFGDNATSSEFEPSHNYSVTGVKHVVLRAYNGGKTNDYSISITITDENPVACFTVATSPVYANQEVQFTNCSENAESYLWDFGDMQTSTLENPKHTYNLSGTYTVTLEAYHASFFDRIEKQITVEESQSGYVNIEFYLDMNVQIANGSFSPLSDYVDLAGTFNNWGVSGNVMVDPDGDGIYYVLIANQSVGSAIDYKFRINGNWETAEFPLGVNRSYTVVNGSNILNHWYNDIPVSGIDPYNYIGIPANRYQNYLVDDFSTNDYGWYLVDDGTFKSVVQNGKYELSNGTTDQTWFVWSSYYGPEQSTDFEMEFSASIQAYNGADDYGAGFFWGKSETDWQYYYYLFSPFGYYTTGIYNNSAYNAWIDWQNISVNPAPGSNLLTLRKIAGNYYFYVNQVYVGQRTSPAFFGDLFGFSVGPQQTLQIDFINIKNINLGTTKSSGVLKNRKGIPSGGIKIKTSK